MGRRFSIAILLIGAFVALPRAQPAEKLDYAAIGQIRDEGSNRSQVMDTLFWLTDRYGPRVTGTPAMADAGAWTMEKMTDWGLANVHREEFRVRQGLVRDQPLPRKALPAPARAGRGSNANER